MVAAFGVVAFVVLLFCLLLGGWVVDLWYDGFREEKRREEKIG